MLKQELCDSVVRRTQNISDIVYANEKGHASKNGVVQVLFSGGLDSALLAAILNECLP
jgi:asparagine synthetase B (glutamine-hydrolysing)